VSRYLMKQNLFSFGDDFIIRDESGSDAFFVDGKVFCLGNQLSFQDMQKRELAYIKQRLLSFGPTYEIYRAGELVAVVAKHVFTFLQCTFTIDVPGPNDLVAQGNFMDHEYTVMRGEAVVATISKKWFSWTDSYGVKIAPGEDDVLLLASTVVVSVRRTHSCGLGYVGGISFPWQRRSGNGSAAECFEGADVVGAVGSLSAERRVGGRVLCG
jgi:uncharacterized protein YxjI